LLVYSIILLFHNAASPVSSAIFLNFISVIFFIHFSTRFKYFNASFHILVSGVNFFSSLTICTTYSHFRVIAVIILSTGILYHSFFKVLLVSFIQFFKSQVDFNISLHSLYIIYGVVHQ